MSTQTVIPFEVAAGKKFMLSGNAYMTAESEKSGVHYTFRVKRAEPRQPGQPDPQLWFVSVLTGPDNTADYTYLGLIRPAAYGGTLRYEHGTKSHISSGAPSANSIRWVIGNLLRDKPTPNCRVYHEGKCGRCGRTLTVPESIVSGYGPECINHV